MEDKIWAVLDDKFGKAGLGLRRKRQLIGGLPQNGDGTSFPAILLFGPGHRRL